MQLEDIKVYTAADQEKTEKRWRFFETALSELKKTPVPLKNLFEEYLTNKFLDDTLTGVDFDDTLVLGDWGNKLFREQIQDSSFWKLYTPEQFQDILLPKNPVKDDDDLSYYRIVKEGAHGKNPDLKREKRTPESEGIKILWTLYEELSSLYGKLKNERTEEELNEFAQKMELFDQTILKLESYFSEFFGNVIFSRIRFLAGHTPKKITSFTKKIIQDHGVELNEPIVSVLTELTKNKNSSQKIVTTNLQRLVRQVIVSSPALSDIFHGNNDIIATKTLRDKNNQFPSPVIKGEPLFGPRKAEKMKQSALSEKKIFRIAVGDSVNNDGPMGAAALENEGIFIVTYNPQKNIEEVISKFRNKVKQILDDNFNPSMLNRMWFLEQSPKEAFVSKKLSKK
ncbi:hypothetical protein K9L27_01380 [Candidatus Gracilibacteria bacterium]|nr:hypothetical protein [Candidatus Gracilibacteria bacterium]